MIKLCITTVLFSVLAFSATAQSFKAETIVKKDVPVEEKNVTVTAKDTVTPSAADAFEGFAVPQKDFSEEIAARGIKMSPSQEELAAAKEDLRTDLRKTVKFNELKEKVNYLEVNDRIDRTNYRRKLQKMGENYELSAKIAARKEGLSVNPKDDAQIERVTFERAGVLDDTKQQ